MKNKITDSLKLFLFLCSTCFCLQLDSHPLRPVPWVTHNAVLFLDQFMSKNPNASVLEFGSGSSTLWFAKRTKNLVSIEHTPEWYLRIHNMLNQDPAANQVNLILHERPYYKVCNHLLNESFDLILVDGRNRKGCIVRSIPLLKRGGVLMIDNAERTYYNEALKLLKNWEKVIDVQTSPDSCGFTYPNWQTHWYIKP